MDRSSVNWTGPMPAVVTPFDDRGAIDERLLQANLELLLEKGSTGFIVGGCTGEFWAMSPDERAQLFKASARIVAGRGTVIAGIGAIMAQDVVTLGRSAQDAGCDGVLILPPYFNKITDDEIVDHFALVTSDIDLPAMIYNIPQAAVNAVTPALASRLAEIDSIVAIKESAGDWNNYYATALTVQDRLRVFCGPSSVYGVPAMVMGADGLIDCFPNVWAPGGLDLYYAVKDGDMDRARSLQKLGVQLTRLFTSEGRTLYPATKAAMEILGLPGGQLRLPMKPLPADQYAGLRRGLTELGLLPQTVPHRLSA
jgi:4-hydroxy-tetrahydrodipicolinate synthase